MTKTPLFINPLTDFGAKKLLLGESGLSHLLDFVNTVLKLPDPIVSLSIASPEQLGHLAEDRKAIFDFSGITSAFEHITIEVQVVDQAYFIDRTIFYSTFPIQAQAKTGDWNFRLNPIYCISILNFLLPDSSKGDAPMQVVQLKDQNNRVFYKKLSYIYLELPNFVLSEYKLTNRLDEWLFLLKNMDTLSEVPQRFQTDALFMELLEKAQIANLSREELSAYEYSLKAQRDYKNTIDFAQEKLARAIDEREEACQREEEARQREKESRQREYESRQREEVLMCKSVLAFHSKGFSANEIVQLLDLDLQKVQRIISEG